MNTKKFSKLIKLAESRLDLEAVIAMIPRQANGHKQSIARILDDGLWYDDLSDDLDGLKDWMLKRLESYTIAEGMGWESKYDMIAHRLMEIGYGESQSTAIAIRFLSLLRKGDESGEVKSSDIAIGGETLEDTFLRLKGKRFSDKIDSLIKESGE